MEDSTAQTQPAMRPTNRIRIYGLGDTNREDLLDLYRKFNPTDAEVKLSVDGRPRGFGFVQFRTIEDATQARLDTDGMVRGGVALRVSFVPAIFDLNLNPRDHRRLSSDSRSMRARTAAPDSPDRSRSSRSRSVLPASPTRSTRERTAAPDSPASERRSRPTRTPSPTESLVDHSPDLLLEPAAIVSAEPAPRKKKATVFVTMVLDGSEMQHANLYTMLASHFQTLCETPK